MNFKHLVVAAVAVLALGASSLAGTAHGAVDGAKPLTGTWTGETSQDIAIVDPGTGETFESEWSVRMTVSVLDGRIVRLYTTIRSVCPGPAVRDHRIAKKWNVGRGPHVSPGGAFTVRLRGTSGRTAVEIAGGLFGSGGSGRLSVKAGDCDGKGTWTLKRRI